MGSRKKREIGWKLSEETKKRMSESWKKRKLTPEYKAYVETIRERGYRNKGYKHTLETRKRMSASHKLKPLRYWLGKKNPNVSKEKHWSWKGGITPFKLSMRKSAMYKHWRLAVYERDKYKCVLCGDDKGGNLNADHHPIPFYKLLDEKDFETMWSIDNGRTLCKPCHLKETIRLDIHRSNQPTYEKP